MSVFEYTSTISAREGAMNPPRKPILVIGGGIAGMTAALEAAEVGHRVILVEKEPSLGGRVVRSYRYFPKMCPPTCGFEINTRRVRLNPRIDVHTLSTVEEISGEAGAFRATIGTLPRYVTPGNALDDSVASSLSSERPNDFNLGMDTTKPLYLQHEAAFPHEYVLDRESLSAEDTKTLKDVAPPGAIDFDMTESRIKVDVGSIIVATGWRPYDPTALDHLGYGRCANVITNVMMERLAAHDGPTAGEILRPLDGKSPENVAFVQCAGSRDENHLSYCSAVCCTASLKQIRYLREKVEGARATMFYIDIRTIGRLESFYTDLLDDPTITFTKGKVAAIDNAPENGKLVLDVEDTIMGQNLHAEFDLVVLATGIVPNAHDAGLPGVLKTDEHGFIDGSTDVEGIFVAGCAKRPCDVARSTKDATGAALKAIQYVNTGA